VAAAAALAAGALTAALSRSPRTPLHGAACSRLRALPRDLPSAEHAQHYYIAGEGTVNMGQAAINAATNTHAQLASIHPSLSSAQIWNMEAMTMLPGIDDYPKKTEVTYLTDAQTMLNFAQANNMNLLSIWAIQRDNGGCPGTRDSNTCSGITQSTWDFSHLLEPFTG
jgi:hypothetical protein